MSVHSIERYEMSIGKLPLTVDLIGVGRHPAIEVKDLNVGETVVWNWGATGKVLSIKPKGTKSASVTFEDDGMVVTQTKRLDTLIAVRR